MAIKKKLVLDSEADVGVHIVQFNGNLAAKEAGFILALTGPSGDMIGQFPLAIIAQDQPETAENDAIPGFDKYLAESAAARKVHEGLLELGAELAGYSKLLVVEDEPADDGLDELSAE